MSSGQEQLRKETILKLQELVEQNTGIRPSADQINRLFDKDFKPKSTLPHWMLLMPSPDVVKSN
jgi:hypothetical protein